MHLEKDKKKKKSLGISPFWCHNFFHVWIFPLCCWLTCFYPVGILVTQTFNLPNNICGLESSFSSRSTDGSTRRGIQGYLASTPCSIGEMAEVQKGEGSVPRTKTSSSWAGDFPNIVLLLTVPWYLCPEICLQYHMAFKCVYLYMYTGWGQK